jgi:hypothetical protein
MRRSGLACLVVSILSGSVACARTPPHLPASVEMNSFFVKVTNEDHQDWRNVRVLVNEKYACPAVDTIAQGATATVKLAGCIAEADGERLQPLRTAAVRIAVAAIQVDDTGEARSSFLP